MAWLLDSPCCRRPCAEETCCGNMCKACRRDWFNPKLPYTVMNVGVQDERIVATSLSGNEICSIPYRRDAPSSSLGSTFRALVASSGSVTDVGKGKWKGVCRKWGADEKMYMAVIGDETFCESDWDYMACTQEEFLPNPVAVPELVLSFTYHRQGTKPAKVFLWERDGAQLLQFNSSKLHGRWIMQKKYDPWHLSLFMHWNGERNRRSKDYISKDDGQTWEQDTTSCCDQRYGSDIIRLPPWLCSHGPLSTECKSYQCGWRSWLSRD